MNTLSITHLGQPPQGKMLELFLLDPLKKRHLTHTWIQSRYVFPLKSAGYFFFLISKKGRRVLAALATLCLHLGK